MGGCTWAKLIVGKTATVHSNLEVHTKQNVFKDARNDQEHIEERLQAIDILVSKTTDDQIFVDEEDVQTCLLQCALLLGGSQDVGTIAGESSSGLSAGQAK